MKIAYRLAIQAETKLWRIRIGGLAVIQLKTETI
jgi:hypothetical protein